jgi:hypothetical protein
MTINHFRVATERTKSIFNPWGDNPYQAIFETQISAQGFAPVDLTILETETGFYAFAHGSVVTYERYDTDKQANWYQENRYKV